MCPKNVQKPPVILIIAGSGPTNKDGNTWQADNTLLLENNSLKMLAENLAEQGIATLRFDKRGVGESLNQGMFDPSHVTFEDFVDDAKAMAEFLIEDQLFERVYISGHSEGALIGSVVANSTKNIDGFISIAGAGRSILDVLSEQLDKNLATAPKLQDKASEIISDLRKEKLTQDIPLELLSVFNQSAQNFILSENCYNPVSELSDISCPVSIIQGTTDIQLLVDDAYLLQSAQPDAQLTIINGMNHVLKSISEDMEEQHASYNDPSLPIHPELTEAIANFVHHTQNPAPDLILEP